MILFTILLLTLLAIAAISLIATVVVGGGFIAVFGDIIVCALLVWLIIKCFTRKKK